MKKICLLFCAGWPLFLLAQKKGFELKGKAGSWHAPAKAYLVYSTQVDSANVTNGEFSFKGLVSEIVSATVILDESGKGLSQLNEQNADFFRFYLDNETMSISSKDSIRRAVISGSAINDESADYTAFVQTNTKKSSALQWKLAAMSPEKQKDPDVQRALQQQMKEARDELKAVLVVYIGQHPHSYFSLLALSNLVFLKADAGTIDSLYKKVSPSLQGTAQGKKTAQEIAMYAATSVGAAAPVFSQPDTSGALISLSAFKGKYVLLDFWASWCMPCREENPNLVRAFAKYHARGLEILGVSLDGANQRGAWLAAIKKDGLAWAQVSDLKGGDNAAALLYGVQSIPQNYLIDPSGKIIALSLRGEDLDKTLQAIFTK